MQNFVESSYSIRPKLENSKHLVSDINSLNFLDEVCIQIEQVISRNTQGPLETMSLKHFKSKGKLIRPMFIRELALSLNLELSDVLDWAISCEILHNATLVHDDLQDGDEVRRGAPTLWKIYGPEQAINVGDFLLMIAPQSIILGPNKNKEQLLHLFTRMSAGVVAGQVNEFELNRTFQLENLMEQYQHCISGKTSTLFSGLALGVSLIAQETRQNSVEIESIFFQLGHIFQMQDDILDLYGDKLRGELGCDIKEGKISYLIVTHLESCPDDFEYIQDILQKDRNLTTDADVIKIKAHFKANKTLRTAITNLEERVDVLLANTYLEQNPLLKKLIVSLVEKVLNPINHIKVS